MKLNDGFGSVAVRIVDVWQLHIIVDRIVDLLKVGWIFLPPVMFLVALIRYHIFDLGRLSTTFQAAIMAASSSLRLVFFLIVLMKSTNASLFTRPFLKKLSSEGNMP